MFRKLIYLTSRSSANWKNFRGLKTSSSLKMSNSRSANTMVWIDLEMTGLDVRKDTILEASCILTDADLNVIAEGPNLIIHQSDAVLKNMNEWCIQKHGETGLTESSRNSKISLKKAEELLLEFLKKHIPKKKCPLAGNTIYVDRQFLREYMPQLDDYLHYRIVDVSSIKELCRRWNPSVFSQAPKKKLVHRSLDDIKESIDELRYYRRFMFPKNYVGSDPEDTVEH